MKKIIICCFALLLHIYVYGQSRKHDTDSGGEAGFLQKQIEDVKNNAEFVFEGIIQKQDFYPRTDNNGTEYCAVSSIIKITKVFRGNLKPGTTIEFVCTQEYYNGFQMPTQRESRKTNSAFLFFCRAAGKDYPYNTKYNIDPVDNKVIITDANYYTRCSYRLPTGNVFGNRFHSKAEYYRYISTLPNINKSVITAEDTTIKVSNHVSYSSTITKAHADSVKRAQELKKKVH
jgi:hypothetical protein